MLEEIPSFNSESSTWRVACLAGECGESDVKVVSDFHVIFQLEDRCYYCEHGLR